MGFLKLQLNGKLEKIMEGEPLETSKKFENKKMSFLEFHSVKGGPVGLFSIHSAANYQKNEGGTLWCNPKIFKVPQPEKKHQNGQRGILSMFSRFWTSVFLVGAF